MTKLVFVESPGKIKKIESYLGEGWIVRSSVGHIRDLPSRELGVDTVSMEAKYELTERGKEVVGKLRRDVANASDVYLATDLDREGEAIAWHLQQVFNLPSNCKRIVFNEITSAAIKKAISEPRVIDLDLVHAQESRRILDRLVGYTVSPMLNQLKLSSTVSAGRVQSIALKLVVERQMLIDAHQSESYFYIHAMFDGWKATFTGELNAPADYKDTKAYRMNDKGLSVRLTVALNQNPELKVASLEQKLRKRTPPPPFTTSVLQQAASVALKISPDETMKLAQKLYEKGLITYMRTDSVFLSEDSISSIRNWISKYQEKKGVDWLLPETKNEHKGNAGAQEAHEAIRPSDIFDVNPDIEGQEKALYQLIWKRTVASQCSSAEIDQMKVTLISRLKVNEKPVSFEAKGEIIVKPGWLLISGNDKSDEDEKDENQKLPPLEQGAVIKPITFDQEEKRTKPPKRYTEAALVKDLEGKGVGRPSTYASIMKTIIMRKYVKVESRLLVPTPLGIELYKAIDQSKFSFFDYGYTQNVEAKLDAIASSKLQRKQFLVDEFSILANEMKGLSLQTSQNKEAFKCSKCGGDVFSMNGKYGAFIACSLCMQKYNKDGTAYVPAEKTYIEDKCNVCNKPMLQLNTQPGKPKYFKCEKCDYLVGATESGSIDISAMPRLSEKLCETHNTQLLIKINAKGEEYTACRKCASTKRSTSKPKTFKKTAKKV
ncbi:DNA topoisomerase 1 [Shewanella inventionis]|uniref:DNA topoisomerase 1 n=1 Tax=Shewanella inventionis TaxID=1738770 RepID=A0ABQ1IYC1_9GAMM|nr:type I DNA topoisomerase [Shewanella inventionis]GGB52717.1 DNA topoisomerase 1 [Shewanella inventionis]